MPSVAAIFGSSSVMYAVPELAERAAFVRTPVFIHGPTDTAKEALAHYGKSGRHLPTGLMHRLMGDHLPGNIDESEDVLFRYALSYASLTSSESVKPLAVTLPQTARDPARVDSPELEFNLGCETRPWIHSGNHPASLEKSPGAYVLP